MKRCSYLTAIKWCNNSFIQFEELWNLDPTLHESLIDENPNFPCGDCNEIFQIFLTNCNEWDVSFLRKNFPNLLFARSRKFDKYVLFVDHFGMGWDYVGTDCTDEIFENIPDTDPIKKEYLKEV